MQSILPVRPRCSNVTMLPLPARSAAMARRCGLLPAWRGWVQAAAWGIVLAAGADAMPAAETPATRLSLAAPQDKGFAPFVTGLCAGADGALWVATEGSGVWRWRPRPDHGAWTGFAAPDGLGEDLTYAIAQDRLGRIWVGHASRGVSVYAEGSWHTYASGSGPLGERVFAIAPCPVRDDVWMATNAGLTRYREDDHSWLNLTRHDGLPGEGVQQVAVDAKGTVYAGMQDAGLAIGVERAGHWLWTHEKSIEEGGNLPSARITSLCLSASGVLAIATDAGLALHSLHDLPAGKWAILRHDDARGADGPGRLNDNYVAYVGDGGAPGMLLVGYRNRPPQTITLATLAIGELPPGSGVDEQHDYLTSAVAVRGTMALGWYGGGLTGALPQPPVPLLPAQAAAPPPIPAAAPTDVELAKLLADARSSGRAGGRKPMAIAVSDDWQTRGTWLGRYGTHFACLCACRSPQDYLWGSGEARVEYLPFIGPQANPLDSLRYWVHWLYTDAERSLELPPPYADGRVRRGMTTAERVRRQSEWDDHGEAYPMSANGPNLYCALVIPEGTHLLSLYNVNKDGHDGPNRYRDYAISLRLLPDGLLHRPLDHSTAVPDIRDLAHWPLLAHRRAVGFWAGVWNQFLVHGPGSFLIEVGRNHSFNTLLAGVMIDDLDPFPAPYFPSEKAAAAGPGTTAAAHDSPMEEQLCMAMERLRVENPQAWAIQSRASYAAALRRFDAAAAPPDRQRLRFTAICAYYLHQFARYEDSLRAMERIPPRDIERAIRWDGEALTNSGHGRDDVLRYLAGNPSNPPLPAKVAGAEPKH